MGDEDPCDGLLISAAVERGWFDRGETLADGCFVDRSTGELQALLVVLEPGERGEATCCASRRAAFGAYRERTQ